MNLLLILGVVLTLICVLVNSERRVYSDRRFYDNPRRSRFRLGGPAGSSRPLLFRGRYGNTQLGSSPSLAGRNAALRAGREGAYEFDDQVNSILPPAKIIVKPTKAPEPQSESITTTVNPNKINIESRIPAVTETQTKTETAVLGGTAILHCYFDSATQIGDFKHSQIWWTKQPQRALDRPVIIGAGTQVRIPDDRLKIVNMPDDTFSILIISRVVSEDQGEYKCSLPTVSGTKTTFTNLKVYDPTNENIETSAADHIVEVGEELDLYCRPEDTSLSVWWSAKTESGDSKEVMRGHDTVQGSDLHIARIGKTASGTYVCNIEVKAGSPLQREFKVLVKERPWAITAFNGGFNVDTFLSKFAKDPEYGDDVNLRCDSGGIPTPTIQWIKDGRPLRNSNKHTIKTYEPTYKDNVVISSLKISNFSPEDEGRYHCKALNEMGDRQREFSLKGYYDVVLPDEPLTLIDGSGEEWF